MKNDQLTPHFRLLEFVHSEVAVEHGIDNSPPEEAVEAMRNLALHLLEPLREVYGGPVLILSGYRNPRVNRLVGGVPFSQHLKGEATDLYIPEGPEVLLGMLKKSGREFDLAILYRGKKILHLSLTKTRKNRNQILWK